MIFYVYLTSVFFFYFCFAVLLLTIYQKIKQHGLPLKRHPIKIRTVTQAFIISIIPIFNVIIGFIMLFSEEVDKSIEKILSEKKNA